MAPSTDDILAAARRLPRRAQAELAEQLLRDAGGEGGARPLEMLHGMSKHELEALANAVVAPGRQRKLKTLLRKNREGTLRDVEREALNALLDDTDRIATLKAKAAYTLSQLERQRPAA